MSTYRKSNKKSATVKPPEPSPDTPVYVLYGEDDQRAAAEARRLVEALCPESERALGLETVEGSAENVEAAVRTVQSVMGAVGTLGFFGARKVVWLKRANFFGGDRLGSSAAVKDAVGKLTELMKTQWPEGHQLVIHATAMDGRTAFFNQCKKQGAAHRFDAPEEGDLIRMAREALKAAGKSADGRALERLAERVAGNSRLLRSEVEKLIAYLGDREQLTQDDVAEMVISTQETQAWDYTDAVGMRRTSGALSALRRILYQDPYAVMRLLYSLESRLRDLLVLKDCMRNRWLAVESSRASWNAPPEAETLLETLYPEKRRNPLHMHPYRLARLGEQALQFSRPDLFRAVQWTADAHEACVSSRLPQALLLEVLTVRITGKHAV